MVICVNICMGNYGVVKVVGGLLQFHTVYDEQLRKSLKNAGCSWNPIKRCWEFPLSNVFYYEEILDIINTYNLLIQDYETQKIILKLKNEFEKRKYLYQLSFATKPFKNIKIKTPEGLSLYDFQKVGVLFIEETNGRTLIADEMGLGKTIQALAYLYNHPELRPVLIICPASLKLNWSREVKKWCEDTTYIISTNKKIPVDYNFYIINYDILHKKLNELKKMDFKVLIIDEAHYIKNPKAKRTNAVLELSKYVRKRDGNIIALTGTPILNKPVELFNILLAIGILDKSAFWTYANLYCEPEEVYIGDGRYITVFNGAANLEHLNRFLRGTVMIRRLKKDVLEQLPDKRRIKISVDIDNRTEYKKAENNFIEWYESIGGEVNSRAELLQRIEALRKLAIKGKIKQCIEFIKNAYENEGKVVVFAHHKHVIEQMYERLSNELDCNLIKIVGGMKVEEKQHAIDTFNNSNNAIIFVSIRAGGEGINLQTANVGIFVELDWTPAILLQAEDRLHRIGQEKTVDIYYLIAEDTIEEYIYKIIKEKFKITTKSLDGEVECKVFEVVKEFALTHSLPEPKLKKKSKAGRRKSIVKISLDTIIKLVSVLREGEVVSNKELAERLGVTPATMVSIRRNLKETMGEYNILFENDSRIMLKNNWRECLIKFMETAAKELH